MTSRQLLGVLLLATPLLSLAERRRLLSFGSDSYKSSITVTNQCDEDGAVYFSSGGDYTGCPEEWGEYDEYAGLCNVAVPSKQTITLNVDRVGTFTWYELWMTGDTVTTDYSSTGDYNYDASFCIELEETTPSYIDSIPSTSALPPSPIEQPELPQSCIEQQDCQCIQDFCLEFCSAEGSSVDSILCGPNVNTDIRPYGGFECSCDSSVGYAWSFDAPEITTPGSPKLSPSPIQSPKLSPSPIQPPSDSPSTVPVDGPKSPQTPESLIPAISGTNKISTISLTISIVMLLLMV